MRVSVGGGDFRNWMKLSAVIINGLAGEGVVFCRSLFSVVGGESFDGGCCAVSVDNAKHAIVAMVVGRSQTSFCFSVILCVFIA